MSDFRTSSSKFWSVMSNTIVASSFMDIYEECLFSAISAFSEFLR